MYVHSKNLLHLSGPIHLQIEVNAVTSILMHKLDIPSNFFTTKGDLQGGYIKEEVPNGGDPILKRLPLHLPVQLQLKPFNRRVMALPQWAFSWHSALFTAWHLDNFNFSEPQLLSM